MKSTLSSALLVLAALSGTQVHADEDGGGVGCLPGGSAAPLTLIGSATSLIELEVLGGANPGPPQGANCNSPRVRAVLQRFTPGSIPQYAPRDHSYEWTPRLWEATRQRTLYVRPSDAAVLQDSQPLSMEIYRQHLLPVDSTRGTGPIELRVLLVRAPPVHEAQGELPVPTEVWVIAQDDNGQLGFLSAPILTQQIAQCEQASTRFGACVQVQPGVENTQVRLRTSEGDRSMNLPAARVTQILLGNIGTTAGQPTDQFDLAHKAIAN